MSKNLKDSIVLVTGGANGIGRALAQEAIRRGAKVMLADATDASAAVAAFRSQGADADWMKVDMRNYEEVAALVARTLARFGSLNVLCSNAGTGTGGGLHETDPLAAKKVLDTNVLGYFHAIHASAPALKAAAAAGQPAYILCTGSEHSLGVPPYVRPMSMYTVSKYATLGLVDTARRDLGPAGVSVSLLAPGWVYTEVVRGHMNASAAFAATVTPYGQEPSDVARMAFDGLLAGQHVIATNPASHAFALERIEALAADIKR